MEFCQLGGKEIICKREKYAKLYLNTFWGSCVQQMCESLSELIFQNLMTANPCFYFNRAFGDSWISASLMMALAQSTTLTS